MHFAKWLQNYLTAKNDEYALQRYLLQHPVTDKKLYRWLKLSEVITSWADCDESVIETFCTLWSKYLHENGQEEKIEKDLAGIRNRMGKTVYPKKKARSRIEIARPFVWA